jgi:hypothetical protein
MPELQGVQLAGELRAALRRKSATVCLGVPLVPLAGPNQILPHLSAAIRVQSNSVASGAFAPCSNTRQQAHAAGAQ